MGILLSSITFSTTQLPIMLTFYRALGADFKTQKVDKGSQIHRAVVSGVEFCLYEAPGGAKPSIPDVQLSFQVADVEESYQKLILIPGVHSILDPTVLTVSKKAIVLDPDGRSVEFFENI